MNNNAPCVMCGTFHCKKCGLSVTGKAHPEHCKCRLGNRAPIVNTGGVMGQILDHLLCASDSKIRREDAKEALILHTTLQFNYKVMELALERACKDQWKQIPPRWKPEHYVKMAAKDIGGPHG